MDERVILVDQSDQEIGTMEKIRAHELGLLHRAISVFLFNNKGELLLQKSLIKIPFWRIVDEHLLLTSKGRRSKYRRGYQKTL